MEIIEFGTEYRARPLALALGFFDSVHVGHQKVIGEAVAYARAAGGDCAPAVFTFSGNPYGALKLGRKLVLDYDERLEKLRALGVAAVVSARFDTAFSALAPNAFLEKLSGSLRLRAVFAGQDFRFGRNAAGGTEELLKAFEGHVDVRVSDFLTVDGEKVSTRRIEEMLVAGDAERAERLLGAPFTLTGRVVGGHRVGRTLGFPTANIAYPEYKAELASAVYFTEVVADGKTYPAITNVGARPTFADEERKVESYLDGFSGDLYGKDITVRFYKLHRQIKKFESAEALRDTLEADKAARGNWRKTV